LSCVDLCEYCDLAWPRFDFVGMDRSQFVLH
jgi:hypothetical protein